MAPEIRRRLNTDREWSLYALADLDEGMFDHCDWWVAGDSGLTRELLVTLPEESGYLNLEFDQLDAAEGRYRYRERREMQRMFLEQIGLLYACGRGLAQIVTSAVVAALLDAGIRTIGLNLERTNTAAIRAYEAIGLRSHLNYYEGAADRLPQS